MIWTVVCEPSGDTLASGASRSALVILITDGENRIELTRVGLVRKNTKHKDVSFADQLQIELDKAQECVATINEFEIYLDELRAEAAKAAQVRVHSILGKRSSVPE